MKRTSRRALICGVRGQDGIFLARLLLSKGYEVWGTSRERQTQDFTNLELLGIRERVHLVKMAPDDFQSVSAAIKRCKPDEVYYLAGQSSVALSFAQPAETMKSFALGTLNMLEACRQAGFPIRLYDAGSSECFGNTSGEPANESTPLRPCSPYGIAKATAHRLVANYREAYGLFACTGMLFNHESPLRPETFVTQKVVKAAGRIAQGSRETLRLGRLDIVRDWGWAPEYVEAMWLMLQQQKPEDFVVATGASHTLSDFVSEAFGVHGLDWREHVVEEPSLFRPAELSVSRADPRKAESKLNWRARYAMADVVRGMTSGLIDGG